MLIVLCAELMFCKLIFAFLIEKYQAETEGKNRRECQREKERERESERERGSKEEQGGESE
jgi:hypothetical protein